MMHPAISLFVALVTLAVAILVIWLLVIGWRKFSNFQNRNTTANRSQNPESNRWVWVMAGAFFGGYLLLGILAMGMPENTSTILFSRGSAIFLVAITTVSVAFSTKTSGGQVLGYMVILVSTISLLKVIEIPEVPTNDHGRSESCAASEKNPPLTPQEKLEQVPVGTWVRFGPREWRVMAPPEPKWSDEMPDQPPRTEYWATSQSGNHNTEVEPNRIIEVRNGNAPYLGTLPGSNQRWRFQSADDEPELITLSW